ncbi:type VI secretion system protein TssA [Dyella caseinilytica]|uniref:Type VI secretion system protein TssA n=1 Tax=Dyella caseinilytica TaxID=1849581 RepID=A0ABX7GYG9_9GAMM|nr:type VI secretion system protein TssA [Dyella caseinilytica]QRN55021.1 type VI secretion system protein TssA [Dyella caseinilytica]GFZ98751.1 type VI secretion-associated protein [Dyella caseinilytica]
MFTHLLKKLLGARSPEAWLQERLAVWADWVAPLSGADGVGRDVAYEDAFLAIRDEVAKLSDIDDALIARSCEQLLKETGKDLRLAGYYAFARLRQHGTAGFADGLELTAALVERYGTAVQPSRQEPKKGALEWLAATRMMDLLATRGAFEPADLERAIAALDLLVRRTQTWPEGMRPNLQPLVSRFEIDEAPAIASESPAAPMLAAKAHSAPGEVVSTRDLIERARVMAAYLRNQENGYLPSARLVRCVRWDTVYEVPPSDNKSRTRLIAPRSELRQQLKRLVLQKQWHELLERVEGAFMEGANHLWLDLQYFQHMALDHAGSPYREWRDLLHTDFSLLLSRLPGVERLAFSDGTPFADDATLEWIARNTVVHELDPVHGLTAAMPTGEAEERGIDWPEIEAQSRDLLDSEGLDATLAWLTQLPGPLSARQRFLQRWLMARLADQAGRDDLARHLLHELDTSVCELNVLHWEPSLTFELKHHLLRVLRQGLNRKHADKVTLTHHIEQLLGELTRLDPARAATLS